MVRFSPSPRRAAAQRPRRGIQIASRALTPPGRRSPHGLMDMQRTLVERRPVVVAVAAIVPLVMCLMLTVLWSSVPAVSAALLLVLVVVAAAATGIRAAGVVAALSSALWFDVLLTEPKGQLAITSPADV